MLLMTFPIAEIPKLIIKIYTQLVENLWIPCLIKIIAEE